MTVLLLASTPEQGLIQLKSWVVGLVPVAWQPVFSSAISAALIFGIFAGIFAISTLIERKGLGRIQNRPGPNRVGPYGLFQPVADGIKMLIKEDIVPTSADGIVHFLAPLVVLAPAAMALAMVPVGPGLAAVDMDAGLLCFFAVGSAAELGAFMAGWASRNKYSVLGAMRSIAQMISFELPLVVSTLVVVMFAGTLSLAGIVENQSHYVYGLPGWNVFTPWGLVGFVIFLIAATAESNRSPFDLPEGESEIIGGFMTEYSGFKYAVFFMGEYFGMFAVSGLAITLFLGGWNAPFSFLTFIPSFLWFFLKLGAMIAWFIWVRGTLPRVRVDQLMNFSWKLLLPLALLNIIAAVFWRFTDSWAFPGALIIRWGITFAVVALPFVGLVRGIASQKNWGPRVYRYAN